jgi:Secretion system C-terminal sorting domain
MTISVLNINGQLVYTPVQLTQIRTILNVEGLPPGVYFIHIIQDGKATTKKIIKQ